MRGIQKPKAILSLRIPKRYFILFHGSQATGRG